jgi:hypothetical protein
MSTMEDVVTNATTMSDPSRVVVGQDTQLVLTDDHVTVSHTERTVFLKKCCFLILINYETLNYKHVYVTKPVF